MPSTTTADEILNALGSLGRAVNRRTAGMVDPGSYWVLHVVHQSEDARLGELAASCNLDSSTISRHVRALEQRGLLRRTPDPDDGRAQRVGLTEAGRTVLEHTRSQRRSLLLERLSAWPREDVTTLLELLQRLTNPVDTEKPANHEGDVDDSH